MVRVKPSHCQYDSSHIGAPTSNDHSSNREDHEDHHSEPVVYAKVNRHRTTDKIAADKTEGDHD